MEWTSLDSFVRKIIRRVWCVLVAFKWWRWMRIRLSEHYCFRLHGYDVDVDLFHRLARRHKIYNFKPEIYFVQPNVNRRCRRCRRRRCRSFGPSLVLFTKVNLDTSIADTHTTAHNNDFLILDIIFGSLWWKWEREIEKERVCVFYDSLITNKIVFGPQPSSHIYSLATATIAERNNFINGPIQVSVFHTYLCSAWIQTECKCAHSCCFFVNFVSSVVVR